MIFIQVILPVLLIFLSGFVLQRTFRLDIKPLSTTAIHVLVPALVFRTFYTTPLDIQLFYIVIISLILLLCLIFITAITAKLFHYDKQHESAMMLITVFMNSGNYGAPVILFAFGQVGFDYAVSIMVFQSIIMSVFGIYYASRGQNGVRTAIRTVLKMPANYTVILAVLLQQWGIQIPVNFFQAIDLVAQAAIPLVMIVLGMQLANVSTKAMEWKGISLATVIRLIASPLIAYVICLFFPLDPILEKVIITLAAMPSAATTTLYAVQFNTHPQFVSSSTLVTTVLSFFTLSCLLIILQ